MLLTVNTYVLLFGLIPPFRLSNSRQDVRGLVWSNYYLTVYFLHLEVRLVLPLLLLLVLDLPDEVLLNQLKRLFPVRVFGSSLGQRQPRSAVRVQFHPLLATAI